jgi:hypothetical protein
MPPAGLEPIIPACERPQTHALDRAAAGIGSTNIKAIKLTVIVRLTGHVRYVGKYSFKICVRKPKEKISVLRHRLTRKENAELDLTDTGYEDAHCFLVGQIMDENLAIINAVLFLQIHQKREIL